MHACLDCLQSLTPQPNLFPSDIAHALWCPACELLYLDNDGTLLRMRTDKPSLRERVHLAIQSWLDDQEKAGRVCRGKTPQKCEPILPTNALALVNAVFDTLKKRKP